MTEQETISLPADAANASETKMRLLCEAADDQKAHGITVLDVRGQTIVADFFIICDGTSVTHIQSISEGVQDKLRERAQLRAKREGDAQSYWMIVDYGDVILHVFSDETREFYDLERLWSDAKVLTYENGVFTEKVMDAESTVDSDASA
jgi:ribosome-associated protein